MNYLSFPKLVLLVVFLFCFSCKKNEIELKPVANFSTLIIEFGEVTFKNKSFNATSYLWDFGDGNTSTEKDPKYSYSTIGNYNVTLTASDGVNSDSYTLLVAIGQVFPENLTQLPALPGGSRTQAFYFTHNGKGYLGGGIGKNPFFEPHYDIWEFEPTTKEWNLVMDYLPSQFRQSVGFAANDIAYFGLGLNNDYTFFEYDFFNEEMTEKSSLPINQISSGAISDAVAFVHNDIPYLIGVGQFNMEKKIWKYNVTLDVWDEVGDYPGGGFSGMFHFLLGDKLYIGLGYELNTFYAIKDFWEYDIINNTWTQKNDFPDLGRAEGISFAYDGNGYIGFGKAIDLNTGSQIHLSDLWKYNVIDDSWQIIENFPVNSKFDLFAFVLGESLFFGGGFDANFQTKDLFYEYKF